MTIEELSVATGVPRRTIRYYVQNHLLAPPEGERRWARYTDAHKARLREIVERRAAGESLDDIRMSAGSPRTLRSRGPARALAASGLLKKTRRAGTPSPADASSPAGAATPETVRRFTPRPGVEVLVSDDALSQAGHEDDLALDAALAAIFRDLGF